MDQSALMSRADDLSKLGLGFTAPNPIVGCIIVDSNNNVIAEEFHNGGAHAESKAINSIKDSSTWCNSIYYFRTM